MLLFGNMSNTDDDIWKALSDPTRRGILDLLRDRPRTTGEICEQFDELSRCGVMKHLGVLEQAQLVLVRREGRQRWNHLNSVPLRRVYERWMSPHVDRLAQVAVRFQDHVEKTNPKGRTKK